MTRFAARGAAALLLTAACAAAAQEPTVPLAGTVHDAQSGRALPGVVVVVELAPRQAVRTDSAGAFRFSAVPPGRAVLRARHPGYAPSDTVLALPHAGPVAVRLRPLTYTLAPLTVRAAQSGAEAERALFDREPLPGVVGVSREELRDVPALAEPDVLRSLQALPGVVLLNDLSAHLHVRGGGPDQNLFLLDDARVFAPYHVFGAFGAFNPDAVSRVDFFRGSIPARFGGALSSVVDVEQRGGGAERLEMEGGASLLAARATAAGALPGGRGGWMLAGRRSDADVVLPRITGNDFPYAFHDAQGRLSIAPSPRQRMQASFLVSGDRYRMTGHGAGGDLLSTWRNGVGSLRWTRLGSGNSSLSATAWLSTFGAELVSGSGEDAPATANRVRIGGVRVEAVRRGEARGIRAGVEVEGGRVVLDGDDEPGSYVAGRTEARHALPALYAEAEQWVGAVRVTPGVRLVHDGRGSGLLVEPRLSGRLHLTPDVALTVGAGRGHQLLSTVRDDRHVMPGAHFWFVHPEGAPASTTDGVGAALEGWRGTGWSFALEGYARVFRGVPRWRPEGSRALSQLRFDDGTGAGAELSLRRHAGRLTGWVGYGWSRVELREEESGRGYAPAWDRRHAVDAAVFYRPAGRLTLSGRGVYGSGLPYWPFTGYVTVPRLEPLAGGTREKGTVPVWADEQDRYPAYFRIDLAARVRFRVARVEVEPYASVQNATGRANVLYYRLLQSPTPAEPTVLVPETAFSSVTIPSLGFDVRF
jgi:hypothetical protein